MAFPGIHWYHTKYHTRRVVLVTKENDAMSAFGMVGYQARAHNRPVVNADEAVSTSGASTIEELVATIVTYIPAEAVTVFTGIVAWRAKNLAQDKPLEWRYFIFGWVFSALVVVALWYANRRRDNTFPFPGFALVMSILAFPFWAGALQPTPFSDWDFYRTGGAAAALGVATIVIGIVGKIWGPEPS
jgi:hypothetical protein